MEVQLSPDQESFVREAISSGRFHRAGDAVKEALQLWEERERKRVSLLAAIDDAEKSISTGKAFEFTSSSLSELTAEIKRLGRERISTDKQSDSK